MFKKTYGILYEQNAYVFTDLFNELENYYARGTVSISLSFLCFLKEFEFYKVKQKNIKYKILF